MHTISQIFENYALTSPTNKMFFFVASQKGSIESKKAIYYPIETTLSFWVVIYLS